MADLSIEIPVGMDISQVNAALKKFGGDIQQTAEYLNELTKSAGKGSTRQIGVQFIGKDSASPVFKAVETSANRSDKAVQNLSRTLTQQTKTQKGSITALKQGLAARKQELAGLNKLDSRYKHVQQQIKGYQSALNKAQGIEKGSIAAKRQLLANLQRQADALVQGSAEQRRFTQEIRKLTAEINGTNGPFSAFFKTLNKLATLQAGFQAFTAIVGGFFGKINEFVGQAKQLEGFELALRNVGLSTIEASQALGEAAAISARLGAPLQQVEKSFKRMVPSLRAVGVNAEDSSKFIEGIAARTQTLGLNTEQSGRFVEAFAQVLSKGKLQAEELNQQISELDGAFRTQLADALDVTTSELEELISNGEITAEVFVKAFGEMENGAEELAKRVKEGNLTVQQFQNIIDKIRIENIRNLGKLLQPAIVGFLELQLASEQFIATVIDSEFGKFLIDVFNNVALGIRDFTTILINTTKALGFFLEPLFGVTRLFSGLLRLSVPVAAAFATLKIATLAYGASVTFASNTLVPFVAGLIKTSIQATVSTAALIKLAAVNLAQSLAGWSVALFEFIKTLVLTRGNLVAAGTELKVYTALQGKASAAALAGVAKFGALAGIIAIIAASWAGYSKATKDADESLKNYNEVQGQTIKSLKEQGVELDKNIKKSARLLNLLKLISGFTAAQQITNIFKTNEIEADLENTYNTVGKLIKDLKLDFDDLGKASGESLKLAVKEIENAREEFKAFIDDAPQLIEILEESGQTENAKRMKQLVANVKIYLGVQEENLVKLREEISSRKELSKEIKNNIKSLEEYDKKRKKEQEQQDLSMTLLEIQYMKQYRDTAKLAADKELLLAAAQKERHDQNIKQLTDELKLIRDTDPEKFGGVEAKKELVERYVKDILAAEKEALEAANKIAEVVANEIERVFKVVSDEAATFEKIAQNVASKIDQVRSGIASTLSTARSAVNAFFDRESEAARGFTAKKEVEQARLRLLAKINNIENTIARLKLETSYKMQQAEIKTLQIRLRGEAQLARRAGQDEQALNIEREAFSLDEVLKLNTQAYQVNKINLDLQKKLKDEQLRQQALNTTILDQNVKLFSHSTNRKIAEDDTNRALGLQKLTLGDIYNAINKIQSVNESLKSSDKKAAQASKNSYNTQAGAMEKVEERLVEMKDLVEKVEEQGGLMNNAFKATDGLINSLVGATRNWTEELDKTKQSALDVLSVLTGGTITGSVGARWMGGPVEGGQTYRVNDAGLGREAFMNKFGNISLLPAGSNINWTAPSSGTIIPAAIVKQLSRNTEYNSRIADSNAKTTPMRSAALGRNSGMDSGNLVKQMTAALSGSGGNQRITNNVTIQSQQPVTDASQIMTNVARMRLRNGRRI